MPATPSGGGRSPIPPTIVSIPTPKPTPTPVIEDTPLFSAPVIGGQCVSAVKNLDDPKLIAYYADLQVINRENLNRTITRAEFIKLVLNAGKVNLLAETDFNSLEPFIDIDRNSWYAPFVIYMLRTKTMNGQEVTDENGNISKIFRPNDSISRAEASKILSELVRRSDQSLPVLEQILSFEDVLPREALSPYIQFAFDSCLLHGRNTIDGHPIDGKPRIFEPFDNITLAETSKILYNITHSNVDANNGNFVSELLSDGGKTIESTISLAKNISDNQNMSNEKASQNVNTNNSPIHSSENSHSDLSGSQLSRPQISILMPKI